MVEDYWLEKPRYEDKNVILELYKHNIPYSPALINYLNFKFKEMLLDNTSEDISLMHQEHLYYNLMLLKYGYTQNF